MENSREINITGTLIWYYYICPREVWLMARQINPDEDDSNVDLGRFIHQNSYERERKEINFGHIKIDILKDGKNGLVIGEVKKSSRFIQSSRMQLAFYLQELEKAGITARGELRFPKEKKKEEVELTPEVREELKRAERDILRVIYMEKPPPPKKIKYCRKCAYSELCWS